MSIREIKSYIQSIKPPVVGLKTSKARFNTLLKHLDSRNRATAEQKLHVLQPLLRGGVGSVATPKRRIAFTTVPVQKGKEFLDLQDRKKTKECLDKTSPIRPCLMKNLGFTTTSSKETGSIGNIGDGLKNYEKSIDDLEYRIENKIGEYGVENEYDYEIGRHDTDETYRKKKRKAKRKAKQKCVFSTKTGRCKRGNEGDEIPCEIFQPGKRCKLKVQEKSDKRRKKHKSSSTSKKHKKKHKKHKKLKKHKNGKRYGHGTFAKHKKKNLKEEDVDEEELIKSIENMF